MFSIVQIVVKSMLAGTEVLHVDEIVIAVLAFIYLE